MQSPDGARHLPPPRPPKGTRIVGIPRRSASSLWLCGSSTRTTVGGKACRLNARWSICFPQRRATVRGRVVAGAGGCGSRAASPTSPSVKPDQIQLTDGVFAANSRRRRAVARTIPIPPSRSRAAARRPVFRAKPRRWSFCSSISPPASGPIRVCPSRRWSRRQARRPRHRRRSPSRPPCRRHRRRRRRSSSTSPDDVIGGNARGASPVCSVLVGPSRRCGCLLRDRCLRRSGGRSSC